MIGPVALGSAILTTLDFGYTPTTPAVRLMAADGTTAIARSTVGIVNLGGTTRGKLLTPATTGWFLPQWDDNNTGPLFPDEAVYVVSTPGVVVPAASSSSPTPGHFYIKRHDTREPIVYQAVEGTTPVDLTGFTQVKFKMRQTINSGILKVNGNATVPDPANGMMQYQWVSTDTDTTGTYFAEFEVTFGDGRVQTFPTTANLSLEYITVHVVDDLDAP